MYSMHAQLYHVHMKDNLHFNYSSGVTQEKSGPPSTPANAWPSGTLAPPTPQMWGLRGPADSLLTEGLNIPDHYTDWPAGFHGPGCWNFWL